MLSSVLKRIVAAIVILIATIAFLANAAGLVGIWIVRQPAVNTVTKLSTLVNDKLGMVDQAMTRISVRVDEGQQALTRVNNAASQLGDRLEQGSPLVTALIRSARDDLAPRIADARAKAVQLRDAVVSVNSVLETLNDFGFARVPTFSNELSAVSERIEAAQSAVQELRDAIDEARTGASANLVAAVAARTTKIEDALTQIKSTTGRYQGTVAQKRQRLTDLSRTVLRAINLVVLSLTAIFLVVAAGQVLLIYVCWQYLRRGRLPTLRVA